MSRVTPVVELDAGGLDDAGAVMLGVRMFRGLLRTHPEWAPADVAAALISSLDPPGRRLTDARYAALVRAVMAETEAAWAREGVVISR